MPFLSLTGVRKQSASVKRRGIKSLPRYTGQDEAPSAVSSVEAEVAFSLLGRLRDFGRVGNSSDLLRIVLEFVGP